MIHAIAITIALLSSATDAAGANMLPTPHYHRAPEDPDWLVRAAQFHGHLGPWSIAGIRLGSAGRTAIEADGHFDVKAVVRGPFEATPRSCFIDGLQLATGATLGKRNLTWEKSEEISVELTNTRTGVVAEVRPTKELLSRLKALGTAVKEAVRDAPEAEKHDAETQVVETAAREIALLSDEEILTLSKPTQ